jgi:eukaryotic-like serine/threonine-protein kinase
LHWGAISAKAVEFLDPALQFEHGRGLYLRALAWLRAGKGPEAGAEFQKILDRKGIRVGLEYPLSSVGIARAAKLSGDPVKAKKAYQDFLALWRDADPDIPTLIAARKEYAALK